MTAEEAMQRRFSKVSAVLVLSLAVATGSSLAAAPRLSEVARAKIAPETLRAFDAGQKSFRVIVHLEAPPAARLAIPPRGIEIPRARLEAVRGTVENDLRELHRHISGGRIEVHQRFRLQTAFSATVDRAALAGIAAQPDVRWIEHEEVWHAMTAEGLALIHADVLHSEGYDGTGTAVAIIDTGIDANHPTLGGGPIPNGKVVYGKDTADNDDDPTDCGSHGTAVASIAAGLPYQWDSGASFAGGVAPGAKILAYKASPTSSCGSFYPSDVTAAIEDAILHRDEYNVAAINLSIGGDTFNGPCDSSPHGSIYTTAINQATAAGIAVFAAAGNEADKSALAVPACLSNAISVGSVYDSSFINGPIGMQYCGNETCTTILCTDYNPITVKTPTCYSNTDDYLDLLAPSEILTAAVPNGTVTSNFGGTSGATPYATGSAALIHQALPNLDPAQIRLLLGMTGEMITDQHDGANGVTRPLLNLEAALNDAGNTVGLGDPTNVAIPNVRGAPTPVNSDAVITATGLVQGVRVALKIKHPNPEQLVVTLVSPAGTRVVLHNHQPGMTPSGSADDIAGINGLYIYYPQ
ncbi:MAG TPA: hypothetical protein ENK19_03360, partial [Acidobacteria bacterium]|nr:hypothetical protein [Acidobacteriota bacterium]